MNFFQKLNNNFKNLNSKKKKNYLLISIVSVILIVCLVTLLVVYLPSNQNSNADQDGGYTIEIRGITADTIVVTKEQILEIGKTKEVVFTQENPIFASDKTDVEGNLIPHTLKGVYLDDVLAEFANGVVSGAYSAMILKADDGYETVLTQETYSTEYGGSKMILAYEYDGIKLSPAQRSGAIRAVFENQIANSWAKKLSVIEFSSASLTLPTASKLNFTEFLDSSFYGNFLKTEIIDDDSYDYTYFGISIQKLIEANILSAETTDKMYLTAWDFILNANGGFYREYINWKSFEYYENAFLVDSYKIDNGELEEASQIPVFNGANLQHGMSVKNILALSVNDTALISLQVAYNRYDENEDNIVFFKDLLCVVNMFDNSKQYDVVSQENATATIDGAMLENATLEKIGNSFILHYGENTINLKSIQIKK